MVNPSFSTCSGLVSSNFWLYIDDFNSCQPHQSWYVDYMLVERHSSLWIDYISVVLKADMKSYIPLETAVIFFLANLFPKQGISSEYVTADLICMGLLGLQGAKTENYKIKNSCPYRDSNSRPLILKSSALSMRLSNPIYKR